MENFDQEIDDLLAKRLAGENTPEEENVIRHWLESSSDNQKYFENLQWLWQHTPEARARPPRAVDTEAALQRVHGRLRQTGGGAKSIPLGFWMRAAAAVFVLAAAVYFFRQNTRTSAPVQIASVERTLTDTLADGSVVTLNRRSGLAVSSGFNRRERRMHLQGEAYFEVKRDTNRPFIVEISDVEVKVVGTAFNVDNATNPEQVIVTVTEGKVRVSARDQALLLTPGEQVVYDKKTGALKRSTAPQNPNLLAYKNRVFHFDATPLRIVVQQVEKVYGVDIDLKNKSLEDCQLTADYNNLSIERVLSLIAESFSLQLEKKENRFVLDGAGCGE